MHRKKTKNIDHNKNMKLIKLILAMNFLTAIVGVSTVMIPTPSQAQAPTAAVWIVCRHPQTNQYTVVSKNGNNGADYAHVIGQGYSPVTGPTTWAAAWAYVKKARGW